MQVAEKIEFPTNPFSELITPGRKSGNCYYVSYKQFETGDASVTLVRLNPDDKFGRGAGGKRKNKSKDQMDETTLYKSKSRARRSVAERGLQIQVDRMLTLTFRENVTDFDAAWDVFRRFIAQCRRKWPNRWAYVAVPELQKRGAVHFHLAIRGWYNVNTMRRLWLKAAGQLGGNVDITSPRKFGKNSWNPKRVCRYLTKYITKSDTVDFNRKRYSSGGKIPPVKQARGYVAIGLPVYKLASEIIRCGTRKQIARYFQCTSYFDVAYFST